MSSPTFADIFSQRLDSIESRAAAVGSNWSELCKAAGTSRSTPDRWRKAAPKTIKIIDEIEAELARLEANKAQK